MKKSNIIASILITGFIVLNVFLTIYAMNGVMEYVSKAIENQNEVTKTLINKQEIKPSYDELKSHNVYILGCAGKELKDDNVNFRLENEEGFCWSGTGSVIKITDTETFILTNNHVAGKDEEEVKLYVKDSKKKISAEVVKYNEIVDASVIKIKGKLEGKTAITSISSIDIQDKVYVVGNPLGVPDIYAEGIMAGYEEDSMLLQLPCIFGNSGSAIYNQKGELVGLVYALETYPGFLGLPMARITHTLAVDNRDIKRFLKSLDLYNE